MLDDSLEAIPDVWRATYDLVSQVPPGMVTTYGEVAKALGDVVASRFVGLAMSMNEDIVRVPCRRVVRSDGTVGGYTSGGPEKKGRLLVDEGVDVRSGKVVNLQDVLFRDFRSDYPLKELRQRQEVLRARVRVPRRNITVERVAGIDVAYSGEHAFVSLLVFDASTTEELERHTVEGDARFPYIPTYLAFRELPLIAPLAKHLDDRTVLMYDGNGLLHPNGLGIATHAGLILDVPTIGVAKSLLCGSVREDRRDGSAPVSCGGKVMGYRIRKGRSGRPVYVSAGNGISARQAVSLARRFMVHSLPEPTRLAHLAARDARLARSHK